jgi:LysM repeat protein
MSVDEIIYEEPEDKSDPAPRPPEPAARPIRRGLSAEWIKFIILCVVMGGVVLAVALSRPYIFNRVIPALFGEFNPAADPGAVEGEEDAAEEPAPGQATPASSEMEEDPGTPAPDAEITPVAEEEEPSQPADFPTAVPAQIHTVAAGETLSSIARQYAITLDALIAANEIANPNQVFAGDQLIIPQP